ncbi:hypothetical protein FT663_00071 [Candidozyma haemuli var. vulneris]|uniref:T6SS Phospholipase effector Tle1-like catalytic domain-containing protein n=1 Tax=Candidozyma haemuli TaxID=45357 RepID=A0A2V1AVL6_9ASCO|nr:hypothetical protein CXQ85_000860 [[Candida] haemuloni]KAF3994051.1 hypothetical protein FT662_00237 [[Candida] haemuloni var. vulneris]KAF3995848.1 hypothetical protein FT663_00071 [[Candida] haemuloni var. vulneris]PVH21865.1 hypothetical protein CXQ85_000860 [[Candida] haemuloni]
MSKNLVLCFEGTAQGFGIPPPSNVIKLFSMLDQTSQTCYYQPGIGTTFGGAVPDIDSRGFFQRYFDTVKNSVDAAFALSFEAHVQAAYLFLMRFWEPGAKTYIFGFSRGGYTARVLIGFLECFGLFHPGSEMLVPMAWKVYMEWEKAGRPKRNPRSSFSLQLRKMFGRKIQIELLGIWDTVNSVGFFTDRIFPFTTCTSIVDHVRHAQSIDERRARFKQVSFQQVEDSSSKIEPTLWSKLRSWSNSWWSNQISVDCSDDILEVWFSGSHGDLGASWGDDENDRRLSEVPFRWMLAEACKFGLKLDKTRLSEYWKVYQPKDSILSYHHDHLSFKAPLYNEKKSLNTADVRVRRFNGRGSSSIFATLGWWLVELIPFSTKLPDKEGRWSTRFSPNLGRSRILPNHPSIHWTVFFRLAVVADYKPNNLPRELGKFLVESLKQAKVALLEEEVKRLESLDLDDIRQTDLHHIWEKVPDDLAWQTKAPAATSES